MIDPGWALLALVSKLLICLATAGALGGLFALWLLAAHSLQIKCLWSSRSTRDGG